VSVVQLYINLLHYQKKISASTFIYVFRAHYSKESTTKVAFSVLILLQHLASLYVDIHNGGSFQPEPSGEITECTKVSIPNEQTKPNTKKKSPNKTPHLSISNY